MRALVDAHDWSSTPLGAREGWSPSLKLTVEIVLASAFPMALRWGPDFVLVYNDSYRPILGDKHPWALGRPAREAWAEVWDQIEPAHTAILNRQSSSIFAEDMLLRIQRRGTDWEDARFTLGYSPVEDPTAPTGIGGVFVTAVEITDRVVSEAALRASDERQRQLLQQMPGFVAVLSGPDHEFTYVNDAYQALAGARDFIGRGVRDVFPELAGQGYYELLDRVYATGEPFSARALPVRLSGEDEDRYVDLLYQPIRDSQGAVTGVFVGGYDASEAHRTAAALRELNAELERRVIERTQARGVTWQVSPDLLGALNSQGYFETSNPAWMTVLGWTEAEVASMSIFELLHPDDLERTRAGFALTQIGQPAIGFSNRYRCKDGRYRWISWVGVPEDGLVYCSGRDITDEVVTAAERDRILLMSRDLIGVASFDGYLKSINPAWSRVLGRTEAELLSAPFSQIIHPDDLAPTAEVLATLQSGRPAHQFHIRLLKSDGEAISLAWSAVPDATPGSDVFYTVGRDITEDLAAAAALRDTQEALRQSQKMEAVGQLTGGLAHDFNNLLAGISGSLELMQIRMQQGRLADVDRYMAAAQSAAKRAGALTHRLLAFSRRQTLDPKPTNVNRLVSGMQDLIERAVGPGIQIQVVGASGLWPAFVDPPQLENALLNLCINARDAMPNGGRLTIETANKWLDERAARQRDMPEGQYLSLCVTDTGTGMSPQVIARAFEPFFTTKPIGEGTGLGLSMIYGFAKQSGGEVRIYSEVGEGTTVCIYLPRHYSETAEEIVAVTPSELPRSEHGATVLVVDDEPIVRMLVTEIVEDLGYLAIEAADGPAGLKVLQSDASIDLLVTDVGLPGGMNGRQMADAGRVSRPDLAVLFITGYAENALFVNGRLAPGMAVLTKPFPVETMAARIRSMVEARRDADR